MGQVIASASMSLDGYIAKDDNTIGRLFDWLQNGEVELPTVDDRITVHLSPRSADYTGEGGSMGWVRCCAGALAPPQRSTAGSRTAPPAHAQLRASTEPAALDRVAWTFAGRALTAVAHASTTTGYVIGPSEEATLVERFTQRFGVPTVATCAAAAAALRTHAVERVQLVHPPWFDTEFDALGAVYFRSQGFDVLVTKATDLPDDPARVEPQHIIDWVERHVQDRAEAIYLAGNGFRAAEALEELETLTGRLVVAANQGLLWAILKATGTGWDVTGHGRLLRADTSTT